MGFKKVYKVLQEIFPEVDSRALRAVAIEHQKDADTAVEVVLTEVIPFLVGSSSPSKSLVETRTALQFPEVELYANGSSKQDAHIQNAACQDGDQHCEFYDAQCQHDQLFHDADGGLPRICGDSSIDKISLMKNYGEKGVTVSGDTSSPVAFAAFICENGACHDDGEAFGDPESEETITSQNRGESNTSLGSNQSSLITLSPLEHASLSINNSVNNPLDIEAANGEKNKENNCSGGNVLEVENSVGHIVTSNVGSSTFSSPESSVQLVALPDVLNADLDIEPNGSKTAACEMESSNKLVHIEDESTLNTGVTRSAQICSIELLEDIIADARNNKKTLFSAMESVISLMREVELQEKAAEEAKEEAVEAGLEIMKSVEDLKQMLQYAKEANDMHAGEVYGEKAILSTEVRELQSRLLSLSEERDKSLAILDEMHQSLEVRLAAAQREREAAEQEKLEKEDIARKALADQNLFMEKVVQEANNLKKEADENAKLREFLVDRGRVVDMLQGEISVICHDVRLLKEKFDERLPLCKSLTSNQTSCVLASSSSSSKSMAPEQVDQVTEQALPLETAAETDLTRYFVEPQNSGPETSIDDKNALIEEGWEMFDNRESYM